MLNTSNEAGDWLSSDSPIKGPVVEGSARQGQPSPSLPARSNDLQAMRERARQQRLAAISGSGTPSSALISPVNISNPGEGTAAAPTPMPSYGALDTSSDNKKGDGLLTQLEAIRNENRRRIDSVAPGVGEVKEREVTSASASHTDPAPLARQLSASLGTSSSAPQMGVTKTNDLQAMREKARQQRLAAQNGASTPSPAATVLSPTYTSLSDPLSPPLLESSGRNKTTIWSPNTSFALPSTPLGPTDATNSSTIHNANGSASGGNANNDSFARSASNASPAIGGDVFAELEALKTANRARIASRGGGDGGTPSTSAPNTGTESAAREVHTPPPPSRDVMAATQGPTSPAAALARDHSATPLSNFDSRAPTDDLFGLAPSGSASSYPSPPHGSHHSVAVSAAERVKAALALAADARTGSPMPNRGQRGQSLPPQQPQPSALHIPPSKSTDQMGSYIGSLSTDSLLAQSSSASRAHDEASTPFLPPHTARGDGYGQRMSTDSKESSCRSSCFLPPACVLPSQPQPQTAPKPGPSSSTHAPATVIAKPRAVRIEAQPARGSHQGASATAAAYSRALSAPSSPKELPNPTTDDHSEGLLTVSSFRSITDGQQPSTSDHQQATSSSGSANAQLASSNSFNRLHTAHPTGMDITPQPSGGGLAKGPLSSSNSIKRATTGQGSSSATTTATAQRRAAPVQKPPSSTTTTATAATPTSIVKKPATAAVSRQAASPLRGTADVAARAASPTNRGAASNTSAGPKAAPPIVATAVSPVGASPTATTNSPSSPLNTTSNTNTSTSGAQSPIFLMSPAARKAAAANQANATLAGAHAHTLLQSLGRSTNSSATFDSTVKSLKDDAIREKEAPPSRVAMAKTVQRNTGAAPPATVAGTKGAQPTKAVVGPKAMVGAPSQRMASPQRSAPKCAAGGKISTSLARPSGPIAASNGVTNTSPASQEEPLQAAIVPPRAIPVTTTTHVKPEEEAEDLFLLADDDMELGHERYDHVPYYDPPIHADPILAHAIEAAAINTEELDRPPSPVEVVKLETSIIKDDSPARDSPQAAAAVVPMAEVATEDPKPAHLSEVVVTPHPLSPPPPMTPPIESAGEEEGDHPFAATVVALDGTYGTLAQSWGSDPCTTNEASHSLAGGREAEEGSPLPQRPEEVPVVNARPAVLTKVSSSASVRKATTGTPVSAMPPSHLPAAKTKKALPKPSVVVAPQPSAAPTGPLFCTNCGHKHVQGGKFCGFCGNKREVLPPQ